MSRMFLILCLSLWISTPSFATLGDMKSSVDTDAQILDGTSTNEIKYPLYSVKQIDAEELSIKEFVANSGVVFAIVWKGSHHPDFKQILGTNYAEFQSAMKNAKKIPGRAPISAGDKVHAEMGGHMRALQGKVYVSSLIPAGVSLDEIHY